MEHFQISVLPDPILHATIVDLMVNRINSWIRAWMDLAVYIHIYIPMALDFNLAHCFDIFSVGTLIECIYCADVSLRGRLKNFSTAGKASQWCYWIPLHHNLLLFFPPPQHFLLTQQAERIWKLFFRRISFFLCKWCAVIYGGSLSLLQLKVPLNPSCPSHYVLFPHWSSFQK